MLATAAATAAALAAGALAAISSSKVVYTPTTPLSSQTMLGAAVGISEDMAVIGARGKDRTANAGKAFVAKRSSGAWSEIWSEIAELSVSTGGASGVDSVYHLGERVVINSNAIIAVSAPESNVTSNSIWNTSGAVFVYAPPSSGWSGTLTQSETLLSSNPEDNGFFGTALAISNNYLIVGASEEQTNGQGRAYVYKYSSSGSPLYSLDFTFHGGAVHVGSNFGAAVAISDTIAFIGAPNEASTSGAVYAYENDGTNWKESSASCIPRDVNNFGTCNRLPAATDGVQNSYQFGTSVAFDGDWLFVGAPGATVNSTTLVGAVYVYKQSSGVWRLSATLEPDSTYVAQYLEFGRTISVSGNYAVVGSDTRDSDPMGRVFVYELIGDTWNEIDTFRGDGPDSSDNENEGFSGSLALTSDYMAVGAPLANTTTGKVYFYRLPCAANYRVSLSGECEACAPGYLNDAGDLTTGGETQCDKCAADYYVKTANSGACTACPTGSTNVAGDDNTGSVTDCDCPSNSVWDAGTGQCECNANYFARASDNTCQPCGTGYENAAGDVVVVTPDPATTSPSAFV